MSCGSNNCLLNPASAGTVWIPEILEQGRLAVSQVLLAKGRWGRGLHIHKARQAQLGTRKTMTDVDVWFAVSRMFWNGLAIEDSMCSNSRGSGQMSSPCLAILQGPCVYGFLCSAPVDWLPPTSIRQHIPHIQVPGFQTHWWEQLRGECEGQPLDICPSVHPA